MSAGKGSDWRKDFDFNKYWTNYPSLSGDNMSKDIKIVKKKGKVTYIYK